MGDGSRRWIAAGLALSALLAALVYLNTLENGFVWDDHQLIVENHRIKSLPLLWESLDQDFFYRNENDLAYGYYRPVILVSYALDYALWALEPLGYHLTNILLHVFCTLLVGVILVRLGVLPAASLTAAALFAVHPVHTETVAWISGRTDLVAFFFCAVALLLFLYARGRPPDRKEGPPEDPPGPRRRLLLGLSALAFALGLLSKEMALVLVPWIAFTDLLIHRRDVRGTLRGLAPFLGVVALYLVWRFVILEVAAPGMPKEHTLGAALLSLPPTLARYLLWMAVPVEQNAYVQNPYVRSLADPRLLASLVLFALVGLILWRTHRSGSLWTSRGRRTLLLVCMLFTSFGPIANIVRTAGPPDMGNMMAERFCYFPSFPFLGLVGVGLGAALARIRRLVRRRGHLRRAWVGVLALLVLLGSARTLARNRDWKDDYTFFTRTVEQTPTAPLIWSQLVVTQILRGDMDEARRALDRALSFRVGDYFVLSAQALWYTVNREYSRALEVQRRIAGQARGGKAAAYNNLAFLYRVTGQQDKALAILQELVEEDLGYSDVQFNLGEIYRERGELQKAVEAYRLAFQERLHDRAVGQALADAEATAGNFAAAEEVYEELRRHHPEDPRLLHNLALVQSRGGDLSTALETMEAVVNGYPGYLEARVNYASLLRSAGRLAEAEIQLETAARLGAGTPEGRRASRLLESLAAGGAG